ncbi:MAG: hypothetical protein ACTSVI_04820 [Promethearchaeota archaeon]
MKNLATRAKSTHIKRASSNLFILVRPGIINEFEQIRENLSNTGYIQVNQSRFYPSSFHH